MRPTRQLPGNANGPGRHCLLKPRSRLKSPIWEISCEIAVRTANGIFYTSRLINRRWPLRRVSLTLSALAGVPRYSSHPQADVRIWQALHTLRSSTDSDPKDRVQPMRHVPAKPVFVPDAVIAPKSPFHAAIVRNVSRVGTQTILPHPAVNTAC
jgi:hypothetical protein